MPNLPTVRVEIAFEGGVTTEEYLHIGDLTRGLLDTATLGPEDTNFFEDVSQWVRTFSSKRGSSRAQGPLVRYEAGTASITLKNDDRRFDPTNLNGPYVVDGATAIEPMKLVRLLATWDGTTYDLWRGYIDKWDLGYNKRLNYSETTVRATDGFKVLANKIRVAGAPVAGGETFGNRINRILNSVAWKTADRDIRFANTTEFQATTLEGDALSELLLTTDTEAGALYMDGAGRVVARNRTDWSALGASINPQGVFGAGEPETTVVLALDGVNDYVSTPNHGSLEPPDAIDIRIAFAPDSWTPVADQYLIGDAGSPAESWILWLGTAGTLRMGTGQGSQGTTVTSSTIPYVVDGRPKLVRATWRADNGSGSRENVFFTKPFDADTVLTDLTSDSGWTQFGSTATAASGIVLGNSDNEIRIGLDPSGIDDYAGKVYAAVVKSPINGTVRANPDFTALPEGSTSAFTDTSPAYTTYGGVTLDGTNDVVDSPDHAGFDVTDLDVRIALTPTDWSPVGNDTLMSKWNATGNQRGWKLELLTDGKLRLSWSNDGTAVLTADSTANMTSFVSNFPGQLAACRVTMDVDDGSGNRVIKFYRQTLDQTSPLLAQIATDTVDIANWIQLGTTVTVAGTTSIFPNTALPTIGGTDDDTEIFAGSVACAVVKSAINGSTIADPDFTGHLVTDTTETDSTGKVWTLRNGAVFVADSSQTGKTWTFGGDAVTELYNGGDELPFSDVSFDYDEGQLYNEIRITRVGGTEQVASDATSQAKYLTRTYLRTDLLFNTDAEALDYADFILARTKDPELRFSRLVIDPLRDPDNLFPQVLGREIGDRITVILRPPPGPSDVVALHLDGAGDYASTPDHASLDITGDLDLRVAVALDDWPPVTAQSLIVKYDGTTQLSYNLYVASGGAAGRLRLAWTTDGSAGTQLEKESTAPVPAVNQEPILIRATLDVDNGASGNDVKFYTKAADTDRGLLEQLLDSSGWTQLGSTVTTAGATSIFSGTSPLFVGHSGETGFPQDADGKFLAACVMNGIDGAVVANPDFTTLPIGTTAGFTDSAGRTWSFNGDATTIETTIPGSSPISRDAFITGVSHEVTVDSWKTTWELQSTFAT